MTCSTEPFTGTNPYSNSMDNLPFSAPKTETDAADPFGEGLTKSAQMGCRDLFYGIERIKLFLPPYVSPNRPAAVLVKAPILIRR